MDPISTDDEEIAHTREKVLRQIHSSIGKEISLHDFRMVPGPTHTNVIFDVVVPYGFRLSDAQVKAEVSRIVREIEGDYFAIVSVDHPFVTDL